MPRQGALARVPGEGAAAEVGGDMLDKKGLESVKASHSERRSGEV